MERFGQMKAEVEILLSLAHPESISLIKVTKNSKVCLQLYAWDTFISGSFAIDLNVAIISVFWMLSYKMWHSKDFYKE